MRISIDGTCRGGGKVYTRFRLNNMPASHQLSIREATTKNGHVPAAIYESIQSGIEKNDRTFIGVFPIVAFTSCTFTIEERDENGRAVDSFDYRLNFTAAKWQSRLNYRLNKELCSEIRDYDEVVAYDKADMQFWSCIEDGNEMLIRGAIYTPYRNDTDLSIECVNDKLEPITFDLTPFGTAKLETSFSAERSRREFQFSLRLAHQTRRLIFRIQDNAHPKFNNFSVLDDGVLRDFIDFNRENRTNAQIDPSYPTWFKEHKATPGALSKQREIAFRVQPKFSIIVPLFNTPSNFFTDMVNSVLAQTYSNWELVLVNASPDNCELSSNVNEATSFDTRIIEVTLKENLGISENTNAGIAAATGDFISFFDHDDLLEPNLLFSYVEAINTHNDIDLLYCDEDKLMPDGSLAQPFFKPDFDLELLRNNNYICHMLTIRKALIDKLNPNSSEYDGAQDHNMTLQAVEQARRIHHVPSVLYHWRICETSTAANANSKPYASEAGIKAVQAHLDRMGIKGSVELARRPFTYRVTYDVPEPNPLVSIIIPTKDQVDILDNCIQSILEKSTYQNYEIVLIENNSTDKDTFAYYSRITQTHKDKIRVVFWEHEFNFSKLMNFGEVHANGDYLLLLNNDTEIISSNWIETMLGICSQPDVGAVGVKLLYPDDTIQHAGVTVTGGVAGHLGHNLPKNDWGYFALLDAQRELSAVTAACMMTKRSTFRQVNGFTEELKVAFNDIDYCLKIRELGQKVIYTPEVELYHYESISRGQDTVNKDKQLRFHREIAYMNYRWASVYVYGDPYSNPNLCHTEPGNTYYKLEMKQ
ncbi:glycosyltransferase family 2 protein [Collinsella intestinalis]|uniref:Glycosyltransferase family 2 protein n=1 Tax=Collinsella intestinalis TaxID=147207 RepID=A0A414FXV9_9ACTN|nr:glycosyltransferase family 2 protein [Collinsella intestinalis]RHD56449.1 glycosyltransferase family 2 protein [Collinsella intestinalis]